VRLDQYLVAHGHAPSRARAVALVESGQVFVNGKAGKPSVSIEENDVVEVKAADHGYVGRGALKLKAVLEATRESLQGAVVVDVGASTGGFTQVALEAGAAKVYAVDVGHGQLHAKVKDDPRVVNMEGTDARRDLTAEMFGPLPDVLVADVSFVSLVKVLPEVVEVLPVQRMFLLVKPQFEVGKEKVGKGGIVKDEAARGAALEAVKECVEGLGYKVVWTGPSPIEGGDGNVEYLLFARR
jgi:23S rRNA (cytidine1920-2'-O)/16S rRNA (cytidine1409-2'-O)-methyltransferase